MESMLFIELKPFSDNVYDYMSDESFQALQEFLRLYPQAGDVEPGTRGCRKLRWPGKGHGKRGGLRIIYYYQAANGRIYLMTLYAKNEESRLPKHYILRLREEIKDG